MDAVLLDLDDTLLPDGAAADAALEAVFADLLSPAEAGAAAASVRREARELWRASPHWEWGQQDLGIASWELLWGPPPDHRLEAWLPGFRADVWRRALAEAGLHEGFAARLSERFAEERRARCKPYPGVLEMLARLGPGHRLAVVTNGPAANQRMKIELAGLQALVELLVISWEVGFAKPDPRIFNLACARLGVEPQRAVMVGDNPRRDVAGARTAGLRAVWVSHGRATPTDLEADAVIEEVTALPAVLSGEVAS